MQCSAASVRPLVDNVAHAPVGETDTLADLTPAERAKYETSASFRSLVDMVHEWDRQDPGWVPRAIEAKERRRAKYGDNPDPDREIADFEAIPT